MGDGALIFAANQKYQQMYGMLYLVFWQMALCYF